MAYAFEGVDIAKPEGYSLQHFKEVFSRWDSAFQNNGWLSIFLSNHDQARLVSRFGNDSPAYRALSSEMLATFIMTMRGTPYYYNGDELGMTNIRFDNIKDYRDVQTLNAYEHEKNTSGDLSKFMKLKAFESRDNGRTPFQWNNTINGGFTTGTPWMKVNLNYTTINEEAENNDPNSVLNYFRKVVTLRKEHQVLVYGQYVLLDKSNPYVYTYIRKNNEEKILVLLNFSSHNATTNIETQIGNAKILLSNYKIAPDIKKTFVTLRPYECTIYKLPL